jgi:hypothetical protein
VLGISEGTVRYYKRLGLPRYDWRYDTDAPVPGHLLTDSELAARETRQARVTNARPKGAQQPGKSRVSHAPRPSAVTSLDDRRRRRA